MQLVSTQNAAGFFKRLKFEIYFKKKRFFRELFSNHFFSLMCLFLAAAFLSASCILFGKIREELWRRRVAVGHVFKKKNVFLLATCPESANKAAAIPFGRLSVQAN